MFTRHLSEKLDAALADTPVVLVNGARQTGKTTLARRLCETGSARRYLTLDDAATLAAAHADPSGFVVRLTGPVVIDEVQKAPALFPAIKIAVDAGRVPGRFLLTGSANVLALPRLSESLAGRMEILTLWPLSQGEIEGVREGFIDAIFAKNEPSPDFRAANRSNILKRVAKGGYPEIQSRDEERRDAWFASYVTTILQRDVRDLAQIEGLTAMPRLLSLLAARTMSLLNFAELSRSTAIPQSTLKRYLSLIETTFLAYTAPAWSGNLSKRLIKTPRLAFGDTGLAAHLSGFSEERMKEDPGRAGHLIENFVATELRKQAGWSRTRSTLFHYRTLSGQEVDFILESNSGKLAGIEVKASATVSAADFRGLRALKEATGKRFHRGVLLYAGSQALPFGRDLFAMPISSLWTLGAKRPSSGR